MSDSFIIIGVVLLAFAGIYLGLVGIWGEGISLTSDTGVSPRFASVFAAVSEDVNDREGQFLISFDNAENLHRAVLDPAQPVAILDVETHIPSNRMYAATDHGLFLSRDGGLTWNRFTTFGREIPADAFVYAIVPLSNDGDSYLVSVFANGVGSVYRTQDGFFTLKKIVDFDREAIYDVRLSGNTLYLAMSTGQLTAYDLRTKEARVLTAFKQPVVRIYTPADGTVYLMLKSGAIVSSNSFSGTFTRMRVPGRTLFGSGVVRDMAWTSNGTMLVLTPSGLYSTQDAKNYELVKTIPLTTNRIDAVAVRWGVIYVVSDDRLFRSYDGGESWTIKDIPNTFRVRDIHFLPGRVIMSA